MIFPTPPADIFLRELTNAIQRADLMNFKKNQDVEIGDNRLILTSPNGTRYAVTVDDAGNLSTVIA